MTYDRITCRVMYLDWLNNFLTIRRFAEYYGIDLKTAKAVIDEGRKVHIFLTDHGIKRPDVNS